MSFVEMLRQLHTARVHHIVVGGVAGQLHGSTRLTNNLDILYATDADNVTRLARLLRSWDAYLRDVEPGLPVEIDPRVLRASEILNLTTRLGNLDVLQRVSGIGSHADALPRSQSFDFGGFAVRGLTLAALTDRCQTRLRQTEGSGTRHRATRPAGYGGAAGGGAPKGATRRPVALRHGVG